MTERMDVKRIVGMENGDAVLSAPLFSVAKPNRLDLWPVSAGFGSWVVVKSIAGNCFTCQKEPTDSERKMFVDAIAAHNAEHKA